MRGGGSPSEAVIYDAMRESQYRTLSGLAAVLPHWVEESLNQG